jgi:hypothetical protein
MLIKTNTDTLFFVKAGENFHIPYISFDDSGYPNSSGEVSISKSCLKDIIAQWSWIESVMYDDDAWAMIYLKLLGFVYVRIIPMFAVI